MSAKLVGAKVQRVEDDRFVRGGGRYVDDVAPDALHAAVLRSPHAHARILSIDVERCRQEMGFREEHLAQFARMPEQIWEAHRRVAKALEDEAQA